LLTLCYSKRTSRSWHATNSADGNELDRLYSTAAQLRSMAETIAELLQTL
jgi:hypothetical protein